MALQKDMTTGSPGKIIFEFTLPVFIGNVFEQQRRRAYYAAARSATEDAFGELNLKLVNTGYQSTKNSISDSKE